MPDVKIRIPPIHTLIATLLKQHIFTLGVPTAGNESARISLYVFDKGQVPLKRENEVVIEKFEYLP